MTDGVKVVLIAGTGQNGATLVCRMLGGLPGVVAVGELGLLWDMALIDGRECACGEPFRSCQFWTRVGQEAFGDWGEVDARRIAALRGSLQFAGSPFPHPFALPFLTWPRLYPAFRRTLEEYRAVMGRLYAGIARASGATAIVDSMKVPAHVFTVAGVPGLDVRVLHLVRDPRGVAFSNLKVVAHQRGGGTFRVRRRPSKAALRWLWINESFHLLAGRGVPTVVERYETFAASPREELVRIASALGLSAPAEALGFLGEHDVELPPAHLVAGNRMRFAAGRIEVRPDDAWMSRLTAGQRAAATAVASPLLGRYGYALRPAAR